MYSGYVHVEVTLLVGSVRTTGAGMRFLASVDE